MTEVASGVTVVGHPLVQHKLSYLRDKDTPTVHFRKLANEVTLLLTYEATKDFPTETDEVETPLERTTVERTRICCNSTSARRSGPARPPRSGWPRCCSR